MKKSPRRTKIVAAAEVTVDYVASVE